MNKETVLKGVLIEETLTYSFIEVCQRYRLPEQLLEEMIEHALFHTPITDKAQIAFDQRALRRLESACRLNRDLDVNLSGVGIVLDLIDEIEILRHELTILRRQTE